MKNLSACISYFEMKSLKKYFLLKLLVISFLQFAAYSFTFAQQPTLLAAWSFDALTAAPTILVIPSDQGIQSSSAILYADGTNGSSAWLSTASNPELTSFSGSTISDPRTTPNAGMALALANSSANDKYIVFVFSTLGYENPQLLFATRGTSSGFTTHQWSWSIDNVSYTDFGSNTVNSTSTFLAKTIDMSAIDNIDNVSKVYLRLKLSGASSATGNNRIDNFVVNATSKGGVSTPMTTVSPSTLTGFAYIAGNGPSTSQQFAASGTNLTASIVVTPPSNFELSSNNTTFSSSAISLAQTAGVVASTPIYVRLKAGLAAGDYTQNITITSTGSTDKQVSCTGNVTDNSAKTVPYSQDFTTTIGDFSAYSVSGNQTWKWGTYDSGCMIMTGFVTGTNTINEDWLISPAINLVSATSAYLSFKEAINFLTSYSDLSVLVSSNYSGTGTPTTATWTPITLSGRSEGNNWNFVDIPKVSLSTLLGQPKVFIAFKFVSNETASSTWEIGSVSVSGEAVIQSEPTNHVTAFGAVSGSITATSIKLAWNENDGSVPATGYLIKASKTAISSPVDSVDSTIDTNLTDGSGNVKVMHGATSYTFTNCSPNTNYNFAIYAYSGSGSTINYKIDGAPTTTASTLITKVETVDHINNIILFSSNGVIYVKSNLTLDSKILINDITGRKVAEKHFNGSFIQISVPYHGVYIVSCIIPGKTCVTRRVIVE